jgi:hypothetical protein
VWGVCFGGVWGGVGGDVVLGVCFEVCVCGGVGWRGGGAVPAAYA